ncbi:hypothetical protein QC764_0040170 [Podospora pseudoanserina]|uniref:Uncharacterized protein n=1 Tax=Podospora pseudoanserina TaxID=2609844 RepID=A0ABR0IIE4_9PEZI|nr:hypothetical protein QC764_0040170 [Podospora pseudoanserina]
MYLKATWKCWTTAEPKKAFSHAAIRNRRSQHYYLLFHDKTWLASSHNCCGSLVLICRTV